MGWKWEVEAYLQDDTGYFYRSVYTGQSLIGALRAMRAAKKKHSGAVRLTWRS